MSNKTTVMQYPFRRWLLISLFSAITMVMLWRVVDLQVVSNDFLRNHGDARSLRVVSITSHRGMILDRNGEPLAISTPVESVWAVPQKVMSGNGDLSALATSLGMDLRELTALLKDRIGREFVYLKRHITPDETAVVRALAIPGVHLQREYKRYYPAAEVTAHIVGFTNIDDSGQEGLELAYDHWLKGAPGSKRVLNDRLGRTIQEIESIHPATPGKQLFVSIDRRVQYLAYRELKAAVAHHKARAGSLLILDTLTGEVVALVGQPSFNPNNRNGLKGEHYRNRAVTDVFEPGSTLKPFTIMAALLSGQFTATSRIETRPGYLRVNDHTIRDARNYGNIDLANVLKKSSNVGASKIALLLGPRKLSELYTSVGLGQPTGSGFPGESSGLLNNYQNWSEVELATISFGYGIAVTMLQLAQAYSVIATDGLLKPVSFQRVNEPVYGKRVLPAAVAGQVREMLESATDADTGGRRASIKGYRVAGKTGTAHKAAGGGYAEHRYMSLFAGMAPASNPRLVLVVVIDEPKAGQHFGGQVAAPVFAKVMEGALRILNIAPDDLPADRRPVMAHNTTLAIQGTAIQGTAIQGPAIQGLTP